MKTLTDLLIGIQPMTGPTGKIFTIKTRYYKSPAPCYKIDINDPNYVGLVVNDLVWEWLEDQPSTSWKVLESDDYNPRRVAVTPELYTMIVMKWS